MNGRILRIITISIVVILCISSFSFAKTQKYDEMNFQLGFGGLINTANILGLIEDVKMFQALSNGTTYEYPGLDPEQSAKLNQISTGMARAILVANILGGMEYGLHMRILWNILIAESDLVLLPFDGSYNGRLDFAVTATAGVRAPFFIMPYITGGIIFTFSFYPEKVAILESWKTNAVFNNFAFSPGIVFRAGCDLKLGKFAIGGYYQYTVKDFQEFGSWYYHLTHGEFAVTASDAAGKIFGAQSRFGGIITFYL